MLQWSNVSYHCLGLGQAVHHLGHSIRLEGARGQFADLRVDDRPLMLPIARRQLPVTVGGLRLFLADCRNVANLTSDAEIHALLDGEIMLGIAPANEPLTRDIVFPIDRRDHLLWTMEEDSHQFAFLGRHWLHHDRFRSHEGVDISLHDARGIQNHPYVAMEAGSVCLVIPVNDHETRLVLASSANPGMYTYYSHAYGPTVRVRPGQRVAAGEILAYPWGDGEWGHLHIALMYHTTPPTPQTFYRNILNIFPQLYELWHGDLAPRPRRWPFAYFDFGRRKELINNRKRGDAFNELVGYGWDIANWCPAEKVETIIHEQGGFARLLPVLHAGTPAEATNPNPYTDFLVNLAAPGQYRVRARVGDLYESSAQHLFLNDCDCGVIRLEAAQTQLTPWHTVDAPASELRVRLGFADEPQRCGLVSLEFHPA